MSLAKGVNVQNGYVRVRITHRGIVIEDRTFGKEDERTLQLASSYANKIYENLRDRRFGLKVREKEIKFSDAAKIFIDRWPKEIDANGKRKHSDEAARRTAAVIEREFIPYFEKYWYDSILPKHVKAWRSRALARGISGQSADKYQGVLGSIFSHLESWCKLEEIDPIKRPSENPCELVDKAGVVKRERLVTPYEVGKLYNSFKQLGDDNGAQIIYYLCLTMMNEKDLRKMQIGETVEIGRSKTGQAINLPMTMLHVLDWRNWLKRWQTARKLAGLQDVQLRDLRKAPINWVTGKHDATLVSQYAAHASVKTTRDNYIIDEAERLIPVMETIKGLLPKI